VLPNAEARINLENAILAGGADSPWQYRFFIPSIASYVGDLFAPTGLTVVQVHQLSHFILDGLAASFILLLSSQIAGFSRNSHAVLLQLVIYAGLNIGLYDHAYAPWSMFEIALWLAVLLALKRNHSWALTVILPVLALVRETGLLLGLAATLLLAMSAKGWLPSLKKTAPALIGLALAALVQVFIRISLAPRNDDITFAEVLAINTSATGLRQVIFNLILLFGLPLIFAWAKEQKSSLNFDWERKVLVSLTPYLISVIGFSIWYEVRLLGVFLPVLAIGAIKILTDSEKLHRVELRNKV
jgi:hypothetical protein